jgi:hypothetical protein
MSVVNNIIQPHLKKNNSGVQIIFVTPFKKQKCQLPKLLYNFI